MALLSGVGDVFIAVPTILALCGRVSIWVYLTLEGGSWRTGSTQTRASVAIFMYYRRSDACNMRFGR